MDYPQWTSGMLEENRTLRQEMLQAQQARLLILGFSSAATPRRRMDEVMIWAQLNGLRRRMPRGRRSSTCPGAGCGSCRTPCVNLPTSNRSTCGHAIDDLPGWLTELDQLVELDFTHNGIEKVSPQGDRAPHWTERARPEREQPGGRVP
jgi:hypothetical protein